jgi:hypothetical protein
MTYAIESNEESSSFSAEESPSDGTDDEGGFKCWKLEDAESNET